MLYQVGDILHIVSGRAEKNVREHVRVKIVMSCRLLKFFFENAPIQSRCASSNDHRDRSFCEPVILPQHPWNQKWKEIVIPTPDYADSGVKQFVGEISGYPVGLKICGKW